MNVQCQACAPETSLGQPSRLLPQITHRETMAGITELTGAAVTTRGIYLMPGQKLQEGERKLALLIQVRQGIAMSIDCHQPSAGLLQ